MIHKYQWKNDMKAGVNAYYNNRYVVSAIEYDNLFASINTGTFESDYFRGHKPIADEIRADTYAYWQEQLKQEGMI